METAVSLILLLGLLNRLRGMSYSEEKDYIKIDRLDDIRCGL